MKNSMRFVSIFSVLLLVLAIFSSMPISGSTSRSSSRASAPTLTNPNVSPATGDNTTSFTFSVLYKDADGDLPLVSYIYIDSNHYSLTTNGTNAVSGISCYYSTQLSTGNHSYYFWFNNSVYQSVRLPTAGSYNHFVNNTSPTPAQPMMFGGAVDPEIGDINTTFSFSVIYSDTDNNQNYWAQVNIDDVGYNMTPEGSNLIKGITLEYSTRLTPGNHTYYFYAQNDAAMTTRYPASGVDIVSVYSGPPPNNKPMLYNHLMEPAQPKVNETINFTIQYKDLDNDAPKYVDFLISKTERNMTNEYDTYKMNIGGDTYSTGVTCYILQHLSEGEYVYYFSTESVRTAANEQNETELFYLKVGSGSGGGTPKLIYGSVSPTNGIAHQTTFKYNVIYQDDFNTPMYHFVVIDNTNYQMSEEPGDSGSLGIYYYYNTTLATGNHTYYFIFSDGKINITLPQTGVYYGPYVSGSGTNNPPVVWLNANPNKGDLNTTFYFNGSGTDQDGDPLFYNMSFSDGYSTTGTDCSDIVVPRTFSRAGNYSVTLTVWDNVTYSSQTIYFIVTGPIYPPSNNNPPVIVTKLQDITYVKKDTVLGISAVGSYDPDNDPLSFKWIITHFKYNYSTIYTVSLFNHTFDLLGNYSIYLEISDGIAKVSDTYIIYCGETIQKLRPTASAAVVVRDMLAGFSGSGSNDLDGSIVSYSWQVGGSSYNGLYYNHTYLTTGYKTAKLTVKDNDGLTDTDVIGFYIGKSSNDSEREDDYNKTLIGTHVEITASTEGAELEVINSESSFQISIITSKENYLKFLVESELSTGKLIILDIQGDLIDLSRSELVEILMDNEEITHSSFSEIIQDSGDEPHYHIIEDADQYQLLIYIPHFSEHTIEVKLKTDQPSNNERNFYDNNPVFWLVLMILTLVIIILIIVAFMQIKKKKDKEFYYDFRVAEEKVNNGVHSNTKSEKDTDDDWDEYF